MTRYFNLCALFILLALDSIKPENYVSVLEGQRAVVECGKLRAQTPSDTFEWMKGSNDLSLNNRYSIDSNGSLVIKVTKSSDSGAYTCASKRRAPDGSSSSTNVAMYLSVKCKWVLILLLRFCDEFFVCVFHTWSFWFSLNILSSQMIFS